MTKIQKILFEYQDSKYGDFSAKLVPTLPRECFIGVRSPSYKEILRELASLPHEEIDQFKKSLPHK
ncbi:MAG: DNA alkylation repair protein, partial [Treponema sp.]|nr:DNA alkylation repair protein [Treponema sp.]